jgi:Prokaryotic N-terminal methylation motif
MVRPKRGILDCSQGFSLVSTLVAVAIGSIVAMLVATVVSDAVKSQRSIINRDEMSEFALFVKDQLMTDQTCEAWLGGQSFTPNPTMSKSILPQEFVINAPGGYGDNTTEKIKQGFKFSLGSIEVKSLTIADKGIKSVPVNIDGKNTERFVARVALTMVNNSGQGYRTRFFEVPVLVDIDTKTVYKCNAELNLSDACEALGFTFDKSTNTCAADKDACLNGGTFIDGSQGSGKDVINPATGGLSCPATFTQTLAGAINITSSKKSSTLHYDKVFQCLKCK